MPGKHGPAPGCKDSKRQSWEPRRGTSRSDAPKLGEGKTCLRGTEGGLNGQREGLNMSANFY